MTQEDKELLLKDLSARLPYGVIVAYKNRENKEGRVELGYGNIGYIAELGSGWWTDCKPYLRPMSSMTEEEKLHMELKFHFSYSDGVLDNVHIFETGGTYDRDGNYEPLTTYREIREVNMDLILEFIHWLNSHHFDYRGLIEKGLALEAPEGMYKNKLC